MFVLTILAYVLANVFRAVILIFVVATFAHVAIFVFSLLIFAPLMVLLDHHIQLIWLISVNIVSFGFMLSNLQFRVINFGSCMKDANKP